MMPSAMLVCFVLGGAPCPLRRRPHLGASVTVEITLNGEVLKEEIRTIEDAATIAQRMREDGKLGAEEAEAMAGALADRWRARNIEPHAGPAVEELEDIEASIDLPDCGLVLEVARSTVAGAGRGLFVRKMPHREPFFFHKGAILCGYAHGAVDHEISRDEARDSGRAVDFAWTGPSQNVLFGQDILRVGDLESQGYRTGTKDTVFVPDDPQPQPPDIMNLGILSNDLAYAQGCTEGQYHERRAANVLGLMPLMKAADDDTKDLAFVRPIVCARCDFLIANEVPMELGTEYGWKYWQSELAPKKKTN
mmetsp:Transcript_16462/g.53608  ORF Transcript_16462/g.53608 Transcript_16462/m.53608 type:complete len:307 (+) Transcript_16462:128-1048(+)